MHDALHHRTVEDPGCVAVVAEGQAPRQHLVEDDAAGPHIRLGRVVLPAAHQHFRRHVAPHAHLWCRRQALLALSLKDWVGEVFCKKQYATDLEGCQLAP